VARRQKQRSKVVVISVAAHVAVAAILALVPQEKLREVVAIAMNEEKPKDEKKPDPPKPPERSPDRPARAPGHNTRPALAAAASPVAEANAFTDIGLALDSSAEGGIAVNIARPEPPPPPPVIAMPKPKVLVARATENTCTEDIIKPRPVQVLRPSYTDEARRARIGGKVRMVLDLDESGSVVNARVLHGLGYGLNEAAMTTARRLRFFPAMRCKKPVATTYILAFRFVPQS
jgi:protein TonB